VALGSPIHRHYETVYLVKAEALDPELEAIKKRITDAIENGKGKVCRWENWGKRKLAFEIAKQQKANYFYVSFVTQQHAVSEVDRNLRIIEQVLQFQTVKLDEAVEFDTFDFEGEAKKRTPLFLTPEEAAAQEKLHRELWGEVGAFGDDDDAVGDDIGIDDEEVR
jgi:small subunit ribosomal protein S6